MRYLVGFMFVLALVAAPLSASAQVDDKGKAAESADTPQPARGVRRWHPEAFVDPLAPDKAKSDFEIEYVPVEPQEATNRRRRRRKIALGVTIPILVVGVVLAIGAGLAARNTAANVQCDCRSGVCFSTTSNPGYCTATDGTHYRRNRKPLSLSQSF